VGAEPLDTSTETRLALEGYRDAITYVLQLASEPDFEYTEQLIKSLHFMMTSYDLKKRPGLWRAGPVFVYNEAYDETNTSKSLLRALRATNDGGVLWMNGDVVFDEELLARTIPLVERDQSFVAVNTDAVGDEEVKYTVDDQGWLAELSKMTAAALGEAVGVNFISGADKGALIRRLAEVADHDYFERGIELAIEHDGLRFATLDISELAAVEVDTPDDLARANASLTTPTGEQR